MIDHLKGRLAGVALGGLLALGTAGAPAKAESVPVSFDCAKAERTVDRFICANAVLRWQELAMSSRYSAAKAVAVGPPLDEIVVIGRAPGWEKVCHVEVNPGGAGVYKKQNKQNRL